MRFTRFVVLASAVVAVGACTSPSTGGSPAASTSSVGSAPASAQPSPSDPTIPAAAMLQLEDLGKDAARLDADADRVSFLRPPRPCGGGGPSDALRLAAARQHYAVSDPALTSGRTPAAGLFELVMTFRPGGAAAYRAELLAEVRRCPRSADGTRIWAVGSDADVVQLTLEQTVTYADEKVQQTLPVFVSTVDDTVVVLSDLGYETSNGDPQLLAKIMDKALSRAAANT